MCSARIVQMDGLYMRIITSSDNTADAVAGSIPVSDSPVQPDADSAGSRTDEFLSTDVRVELKDDPCDDRQYPFVDVPNSELLLWTSMKEEIPDDWLPDGAAKEEPVYKCTCSSESGDDWLPDGHITEEPVHKCTCTEPRDDTRSQPGDDAEQPVAVKIEQFQSGCSLDQPVIGMENMPAGQVSTVVTDHHTAVHSEKKSRNSVRGICRKTSEWNSQLPGHLNTQVTTRRYSCKFCEKSWPGSDDLIEHMLAGCDATATSGKAALEGGKCCNFKVCRRAFPCSLCLSHHLLTHKTGGYNPRCSQAKTGDHYKCQTCAKKLGDRVSLMQHKYTHTLPYRCPFCLQGLARYSTLARHMLNCRGRKIRRILSRTRTVPFLDRHQLRSHLETHLE